MLILGIDDSGRGPVIGPMILAGVLIDSELEKEFKKQGVKDSKKLTPRKREILADIIKKKALAYEVIIISSQEIDARVTGRINLNTIEAMKAAEIINRISEKTKAIEKIKVVADCPSPNISKWTATLKKYVASPEKFDFVVEHKADVNHIACSAASIIAKSAREAEVEKIRKKIGKDFGSGYSSDPLTVKFLKEYYKEHKNDGIFRETWGTIKNNKSALEQKKLEEY